MRRADTVSSAADPEPLPTQCPGDSGRMGAMTTTIWQVDIPDGDSSIGPPRIEWQRLDALDQPWHRIEIDDVRNLPQGKSVRIYYCVVEADLKKMMMGKRAGADDFLLKPFDRKILTQVFGNLSIAA